MNGAIRCRKTVGETKNDSKRLYESRALGKLE